MTHTHVRPWGQVACALGLALSIVASPVSAQKKGRLTAVEGRTEADDAAAEEAREAREKREGRVPAVVQEQEREKVEKQEQAALTIQQFGRRQIELKVAAKRLELVQYLDQILAQDPPDTEKPGPRKK